MVKDTIENTALRSYGEAARAELKRHIERVDHRRRVTRGVDFWDALCKELEGVAGVYKTWAAQAQDNPKAAARKKLTGCAKTINKLRDYLTDPALLNWDVASSDGLRRAVKAESPKRLEHLARELADLQDELETHARELQRVFDGAKKTYATSVNDHEAWLVGVILDVGHRVFGAKVGNENGPMVTFLRRALEPLLGRATPSATALRTIVRREGRSAPRGNDAC